MSSLPLLACTVIGLFLHAQVLLMRAYHHLLNCAQFQYRISMHVCCGVPCSATEFSCKRVLLHKHRNPQILLHGSSIHTASSAPTILRTAVLFGLCYWKQRCFAFAFASTVTNPSLFVYFVCASVRVWKLSLNGCNDYSINSSAKSQRICLDAHHINKQFFVDVSFKILFCLSLFLNSFLFAISP